jgi:hypothetical protein
VTRFAFAIELPPGLVVELGLVLGQALGPVLERALALAQVLVRVLAEHNPPVARLPALKLSRPYLLLLAIYSSSFILPSLINYSCPLNTGHII